MAPVTTDTRNTITLKGSTKLVTEFFNLAVNSILFQRGVYNEDHFEQKKLHGLAVMLTKDEELRAYLEQVMVQMSAWVLQGSLEKLVLVLSDAESREVLERWTFDVQTDKGVLEGGALPDKPEAEIRSEMKAVIRQIMASVTFLPLLQQPCTFDLLVYTNHYSSVPSEWEESESRNITGLIEMSELRTFTTKVHKVSTTVTYKKQPE